MHPRHISLTTLTCIILAPQRGKNQQRRIGACKEAGIDPRWVLKTIYLNDAKFHTALARQSAKVIDVTSSYSAIGACFEGARAARMFHAFVV